MGKLFDRVKMIVASAPGTGTVTLGSAVSGFLSFAGGGVANSDVVSYIIEEGANWEKGQGTYTASGTTLARTTITGSSNSGSAVSFGATAIVYLTPLARDFNAGHGPLFWAVNTSFLVGPGLWIKVPLNTEYWDTDNAFNTSTYRFQPAVAGYYWLNGNLAATYTSAYIVGNFAYNGSLNQSFGGATVAWFQTGSAMYYFNGSTDYAELYIYSDYAYGQNFSTWMQGALVRVA